MRQQLLFVYQLLIQHLADLSLLNGVQLVVYYFLIFNEQLVRLIHHLKLPCAMPQSSNLGELVKVIELFRCDKRRLNRLLGVV